MKTGGLESNIKSLSRLITLKTKKLAVLFLVIVMAKTNSKRKGLLTFRFLTSRKSFKKKETRRGRAEADKRATRERQYGCRVACGTSSCCTTLIVCFFAVGPAAPNASAFVLFIFMLCAGNTKFLQNRL